MKVTLPYQRSASLTAASDYCPPAASASCRSISRSKQLGACSIVCAIPARDVVIDFGKFRGSRMGTLPSNYLRWLIREAGLDSTRSRLAVWGDYAKQVLHDPYYLDRLEWESIEKLAARGDLRKSGPPTGNIGVKGSMQALGWDLSDHNGWSQVNFSLLGTSLGGRIPRKQRNPSPEPTISNCKPTTTKPRLASGVSTMKATVSGSFILPSAAAPPKNPALKSSLLNAAANKQDPKAKPQPSQSLSLQEELLRRRQLRKERLSPNASTMPATEKVRTLFPGRESLLKKAKDRADK